ncbi:alpha-galactosidase [Flavivirga abyssicola]|uniref:alpha-galactosidase n=1 Tax=Flavivirga abyssicola TaxID=3063533 RepID=UPI0026DEC64E|nr:alpha-galactosidase [Flavivirga sp. MEBiC07777]WVK13773.1 alpha-galactosidase [Flavivirga sp. MEBiC07777]
MKRNEFFKTVGLGGLAMASFPLSAQMTSSKSQNILTNAGEQVAFKVKTPLFCPYNSIGLPTQKGGDAYYYQSEAFTHNPFTIEASGMSGSPIIIDAEGKFIGFTTTRGFENAVFSFDGKETLTVGVPEGQELFIDETGAGDEAWKAYNRMMMQRLNFEPIIQHPSFWADVEYCTWSEQKYMATKRHEHFHLLNHKFVEDYLDKIIAYGYPKGKMTLDHGWGMFPAGTINSGFGSWFPDPKKFPDFRKTMEMIVNKGFTPGLWIGFPKIHKDSIKAEKYPELLGAFKQGTNASRKDDIQWLNPKADIFEYASEVISRFYDMGVMKFKIDMSYNTKSDMLHIHKELYRAAKAIDKHIEMEFHVPDIFFTKYTDVTRTNDVWLNDKYDWPARVKTHYKVTHNSSPGRGINLDHIGGNDTKAITEEKFLKHLAMYKTKTGYPLVSVLPHHYGQKCVDKTGEYLWAYEKGPKHIISDFF